MQSVHWSKETAPGGWKLGLFIMSPTLHNILEIRGINYFIDAVIGGSKALLFPPNTKKNKNPDNLDLNTDAHSIEAFDAVTKHFYLNV